MDSLVHYGYVPRGALSSLGVEIGHKKHINPTPVPYEMLMLVVDTNNKKPKKNK